MSETHPVPELFHSRKAKILADLSIPDAEYTDLSPKGSVDEGIRDLIADINALPGLVTTSSCAGRISVFLEGRRKQQQQQQEPERQFVPSGGKGAGKWLYVSHDPFKSSSAEEGGRKKSLHEKFGMVEGDGKMPADKPLRLVRFSFEPMVSYFSRLHLDAFFCTVLKGSRIELAFLHYYLLLKLPCRFHPYFPSYLSHRRTPFHINHHEPSLAKEPN